MNIASLRVYLQPAPTLRWHPWAPRVAAIVCVGLVFALGADFGFELAKRQARSAQYLPAFEEAAIYLEQDHRPTAGLIRRASMIDGAIQTWVDEESDPGWFSRLADRAEATPPRHRFTQHQLVHDNIVWLAEWRLAHLAGSAPQWQATAGYCRDFGRQGLDVAAQYQKAAAAYSALLGREIGAAQLAPAVPGGKCS